mgnify:CR=1 FL=1
MAAIAGPPPGFTLKWFGRAWDRPDVWEALTLSVQVASIATAARAAVGA